MLDWKYKNYYLRKADYRDVAGLVSITNDDEVMRFFGVWGSYLDEEKAKGEIDWYNDLFEQTGGRWIIANRDTDEYVGDIGLFQFDAEHNKVELGYKLGREHSGQGVISSVIAAIVDWGFKTYPYNRIQASVDPRNEGSRKVLLNNGFTSEGVLRDYELERGEYVDIEMFSILRRDVEKGD